MDTLRTLLIGTLVGAPLVAYGLSCLEGKLSRRALLIAAQLAATAVLLSTIGLFLTPPLRSQPFDEFLVTFEEFRLVTWLSMPGFEVTFGVRLDGFTFVQTTLVSVVLLLVLSAWPPEVSLRWLMLAWFGVTTANVAGNLGQMFVGWTLSAWASSELARKGDRSLRPVWLVQRISDIALLAGFGIVWTHFNFSFDFRAWTPEANAALRPELIESIALCVLVGIIGRCAQLPLSVWLETEAGFAAQAGSSMTKLSDEMVGLWNVPVGHQVAERLKADPSNRWHDSNDDSVPPVVLAWWLSAAFLPVGIGLLIRFEPLLAVASHTRLLMVAVGAFTMLICSANAVAQNNWSRVLSQIAVAQCGLVLVGLGLDHAAGNAVRLLFLWQSVMLSVLLIATRPESRSRFSGAVTFAILGWASGLWGRHSVLNVIWEHSQPVANQTPDSVSLVFGSTESRVWMLVMGMSCVAELLTSFALLRAWFNARRQRQAEGRLPEPSTFGLGFVIGGLLVGGLVMGIAGASTHRLVFLQLGPMLPLSAAGAVLAWWLYSQPSSLPEKFAAALGPFARLSRNRFYWDDLYFLLIVHPAKVSGEWLRWFDERVLGHGVRTLRSRLLSSLGESAEPLVAGSAMIGALTTLSSVAVLAWLLLWLKS